MPVYSVLLVVTSIISLPSQLQVLSLVVLRSSSHTLPLVRSIISAAGDKEFDRDNVPKEMTSAIEGF